LNKEKGDGKTSFLEIWFLHAYILQGEQGEGKKEGKKERIASDTCRQQSAINNKVTTTINQPLLTTTTTNNQQQEHLP
jgi:hypothetical protein